MGALAVPVAMGRMLDLAASFPAAFVAGAAVQVLALGAACFTPHHSQCAGEGSVTSAGA